MYWYLDCCGGRKYYRVGALPCGLETLGTPNSSLGGGPGLNLPKDLVLKRLSCLNLLTDPPVQGSQKVDMPRLAQGSNSREADLP